MHAWVMLLGLMTCAPLTSATTVLFESSFDAFEGTGLDSSGLTGALDSNVWRILGLSDGPSPDYS